MPQSGCDYHIFEHEMHILEETVNKCKRNGNVLIIGDINCHFGSNVDVRGWGVTSKQGRGMLQLTERQCLSIIDMGYKCEGPQYTYHSGANKSYIDHCIINRDFEQYILKCYIHEENLQNLSDHLPLTVDIDIELTNVYFENNKNYNVAWHKMSKDEIENKYTQPLDKLLEDKLSELNLDILDMDECITNEYVDSDIVFENITEAICTVTKKLPCTKFSKRLKPYWSPTLIALSKDKKQAYKAWKGAGQPRDEHNPLWRLYKESKRQFRREQRRAEMNYELEFMNKLEQIEEIDNRYYWFLVNKSRKIYTKKINPIKVGDKVLRNPEHIRQEWAYYFKNLFTPTCETHFDEKFKSHVESEIENYENSEFPNSNQTHFTLIDFKQAFKGMKVRKAPGYDNVTVEHIKYGGNVLHKCLLLLYNNMRNNKKMPVGMKRGMLIPIPKGQKDPMIQENNRGITLLTTFYKIYQNLIKQELGRDIDNNVDEIQAAGRKGISCIHTSYLLREVISHNLEQEKKLFLAFLDVKKAFDSVWVDGLLYKIKEAQINKSVWHIIKDLFTNIQCTVQIAGERSDWFEVKRGIPQGAPLSLWFYQVFTNDLIQQLRNSNLGASIDDVNISCPAFADDLALVCTSHANLQKMLHIAFLHSKKWRYSYNAKKSEILMFNTEHEKYTFWLGNESIPIVKQVTHLGTCVANNEKSVEHFVENKLYKGKQKLMAVQGLGSRSVPLTFKAQSKIYWTITVPTITYGFEVMQTNEKIMDTIETAHRRIAKTVQRLPDQTPNPVVLPLAGWKTLGSVIDTMKIMFLWAILVLHDDNIYKKTAVKRIRAWYNSNGYQKGPTARMMKCIKTYFTDAEIMNIVENNTWSKQTWKKEVKLRIYSLEYRKYQTTISMYKGLSIVEHCIQFGKVWPWWQHSSRYPSKSRMCQLLSRIFVCSNHFINDTDVFKNQICGFCETSYTYDVSHFLFQCKKYRTMRDIAWPETLNTLPHALKQEVEGMTHYEKTVFIFSGMKSKYIPEFVDVYNVLLEFVYKMYMFKEKMDNGK
jgi:hypothetical protein